MSQLLKISSRWLNSYGPKLEIHRLLITSVGFGLLLLLARIAYTGKIMFAFLVWNLFLAFVPYFLSYQLSIRPWWIANKWKFAAVFMVWLLFIPNSFYILTDLFHLYDGHNVPRWFDLLLIISYAWNGLMMGIMSVRHLEKIVGAIWLYRFEGLFVFPIMWLNALGVYIGRYMRFNSWDLFSNPFQLVMDIIKVLIHPVNYISAWGMIMSFTFFLSIFYMTIKRMSRSVW
jgi:uncharacterized membrane protein